MEAPIDTASRPNILFVFDDQQRHSSLGAYGNEVIKTPHFDAFAAEGVVFDKAYSSCPICGPYRGQLMTGRYSHANGVLDNQYRLHADQAVMAEELSKGGYRTGYIGKWHLGVGPYTKEKRHGFDYMAANNCQHEYPYRQKYWENENGPIQIDGWGPEGETDLAIRFMEKHIASHAADPFALFLAWGPPHWPYDKYPKAFDTYDPKQIDLPPNVPPQMEAFARKELADYYGTISALDAQFGRLMSALGRLKLAQDTIVIFTSDHGDHLSSHGYGKPRDKWMHPSRRASKATPYEESIRVPFMARWPKQIPAGSRTGSLLSSVDLMPSMLGLCGLPIPDSVQGSDFSHHFLGQEGPAADSVYLQILGEGWPERGEFVGFWRGLRTERWTYARWKNNQYPTLLFDNDKDPFQLKNLAGRPEHQAIQQELEIRLLRWMVETQDPFESGERDRDTGMLELGQRLISVKNITNTHRYR